MASPLTIHIRQGENYSGPIEYVINLLRRHAGEIEIVQNETSDVLFNHTANASEPIAEHFYAAYEQPGPLPHHEWMQKDPVIRTETGEEDLIATCFYMVNCLQERDAVEGDIDQFDRFKYTSSYQHRFGCITEDLVSNYLERLATKWGLQIHAKAPSRIHISHDIDVLGGSIAHQIYRLGRQGRIADALESFTRGGDVYNNLEQLDQINASHGIHSTYFFLTEEGRGKYGIKNADYDITEYDDLIRQLEERGNEIGLHKSASHLSFEEELGHLPVPTSFNRYHFLCHQPHRDWKVMEEAGVSVDCSLGFAEHYGFRNSYGLPFKPYDPISHQAMNLVVSPLHVMDGTLWSYMKLETEELTSHITDFLAKHRTGKVLSVLWHNTSITDIAFPGLTETYRSILEWLDRSDLPSITLRQLAEENDIYPL